MEEKILCEYCMKPNKIYKLGYCKACYNLMLKTKYILNPKSKFSNDSEKDLIMYFLEHPQISKKKLAKKFNVAISTVYYNIKKHTICIKVED